MVTSWLIMNAGERVEFAVRFAAMDLETLRPGDKLNLQDDLREFFGHPRNGRDESPADGMRQAGHRGA